MVRTPYRQLSRQQLEIVLLLMEHQPAPVHIDFFTEKDQLNIRGYTERITEARKLGFSIENTAKGYYRIKGKPQPTLEDLKYIYIESKKRGYTALMARCVAVADQMKFAKTVWESLT